MLRQPSNCPICGLKGKRNETICRVCGAILYPEDYDKPVSEIPITLEDFYKKQANKEGSISMSINLIPKSGDSIPGSNPAPENSDSKETESNNKREGKNMDSTQEQQTILLKEIADNTKKKATTSKKPASNSSPKPKNKGGKTMENEGILNNKDSEAENTAEAAKAKANAEAKRATEAEAAVEAAKAKANAEAKRATEAEAAIETAEAARKAAEARATDAKASAEAAEAKAAKIAEKAAEARAAIETAEAARKAAEARADTEAKKATEAKADAEIANAKAADAKATAEAAEAKADAEARKADKAKADAKAAIEAAEARVAKKTVSPTNHSSWPKWLFWLLVLIAILFFAGYAINRFFPVTGTPVAATEQPATPVATVPETGTTPVVASNFPLMGHQYLACYKGGARANDYYAEWGTKDNMLQLWQPRLPSKNDRVEHTIAIKLASGYSYTFNGVESTLNLDMNCDGTTEYLAADTEDGKIFSIPADAGIVENGIRVVWATIWSNTPSGGTQILVNGPIGQ